MIWYRDVVIVLLVLSVVAVSGVVEWHRSNIGCEVGQYGPNVKFETAFDATNETVTVSHAGGDQLSPKDDEGTIALFVTITDADTGTKERIMWMNKKIGDPPIKTGATLQIGQSETEITLSPGDVVRVWWRGNIGYHWPLWCYNQGKGNHLVGKAQISSSGN